MSDPEEEKISLVDDEGEFDVTREALMALLGIDDPNDEVLTDFFGFSKQEE